MLRAILFDFNGVLVDDEPIHFALLREVLAEEGVALSEADYYSRLLGLDDRSCFAAALAQAGRRADPTYLMRLVARKASYYQAAVHARGLPFFPGAVELVREAAAQGLMLGVVTGALRDEVEQALSSGGLRPLFKVLVTAEDVDSGKPDPAAYLKGVEQLNSQPPLPSRLIHPHEVLAVEDSPAGLEAASAAGLVTLGIAHSRPAHALRGAAALVADRLEGMALERLQSLFAEASRR